MFIQRDWTKKFILGYWHQASVFVVIKKVEFLFYFHDLKFKNFLPELP